MASRVSVPGNSPKSLTPDLRIRLISGLLSTCAIQDLNTALLESCQATGWLDAVRDRAVQLIGSGTCNTYEQVMAALQEESIGTQIEKVRANRLVNGSSRGAVADGVRASGGGGEGVQRDWPENDDGLNDGFMREEKVDVTIPKKLIEDGKRFVKEALDQIVVIEESE